MMITMKKNIWLFIFGLSLVSTASANEIPADVQKWIDEELAKAIVKEPIDLNSDAFFNTTPARLIGYIKDYDASLGFETGCVNMKNDLTGEDYPLVVLIQPDGRFEVELPMLHPIYNSIIVNEKWLHFYIEPGQKLAMILDATLNDIQFQGTLGQVNQELRLARNYADKLPLVSPYMDESLKLSPNDYKTANKEICGNYENALKNFAEKENFTSKTKEILSTQQQVIYANNILEYSFYKSLNPDDKTEYPADFYDFLQAIPMNNQVLLISDNFSLFINRFE
jgi:hypothetical protein